MDDDPDDLAAAFFAQQAAKEKAKATLPTEEWRRVFEAKRKRSAPASASEGGKAMDASSWLVTTMPPAPERREGKDGGIVGMILDQSNIHCGGGTGDDANASGEQELTAAEKEARGRLKEHMVQRLEEKMSR